MKKINLLYTIESPNIAGTEKHLMNLCSHLDNRSYHIIITCPVFGNLSPELQNMGITVINVNFKSIFDIKTLFRLIYIIKKEKIDIVHNHLGKSAFLGTLGAKLARAKIIITTRHFLKPNYSFSKNPIKRYVPILLYRFINLLNTKLIAVSESVRQSIIKREKINPNKIITIYNGTDLEPKEVKETNGWKIGVLSRLSIEKGIDYLINAMPKVLEEFPDAECLIAGIGPQKEELKQKVSNLGLTEKVKFLGYVNNVTEFLSKIDLFVLPAIEEPFGLAIIEAQICNKPVISTNAGGPKEIIKNNETGILVPPKNSHALADSIVTLFKQRRVAKKIAVAGQKRAVELFTVERMVQKTSSLYQMLLMYMEKKE